LQGEVPPMSIQEIVDSIRDDIEDFDEEYLPFEAERKYY
jgi:hypothetical protein